MAPIEENVILVVDWHEGGRQSSMLNVEWVTDFKCVGCRCPEEALELIASQTNTGSPKIVAIVSEAFFPGQDGSELQKMSDAAQKIGAAGIPVIFVTSAAPFEMPDFLIGRDDVFEKGSMADYHNLEIRLKGIKTSHAASSDVSGLAEKRFPASLHQADPALPKQAIRSGVKSR